MNYLFFFLAIPCRILVPQPGIKPVPPEMEAWSLKGHGVLTTGPPEKSLNYLLKNEAFFQESVILKFNVEI